MFITWILTNISIQCRDYNNEKCISLRTAILKIYVKELRKDIVDIKVISRLSSLRLIFSNVLNLIVFYFSNSTVVLIIMTRVTKNSLGHIFIGRTFSNRCCNISYADHFVFFENQWPNIDFNIAGYSRILSKEFSQ